MKESLHYENISKYITIVIPTKNEEKYIEKTLEQITFQYGSSGIKVIIADNNSTDRTVELSTMFANRNHIDLEVVEGGLPSVGRNKGAGVVKTPYILFLDADITFTKRTAIQTAFRKIMKNEYWVVSTTPKYSGELDFKALIMFWVSKYITIFLSKTYPFSIGSFTLVRKNIFHQIGGYDERAIQSEDWLFSKQILTNKFGLICGLITQDNRRFKRFGYMNMVKMTIKNWLNRNNKEYFYKDNGYWN
jgi:glycosyltransferase involved in cell wall biosynthesis